MAVNRPLRRRDWWKTAVVPAVLVGLAAIGLSARIWLAAVSAGSNDIVTWQWFATLIDAHGVASLYQTERLYNHPPLIGYLAWACLRVSHALGLPFAPIFKLPMIIADTLTAVVLWRSGTSGAGRRRPRWPSRRTRSASCRCW